MEPTQQLIDQLYREEILDARRQSWAEKFLACGECYELALAFVEAGIRHQFPDIDDRGVNEVLEKRLRLSRKLDEIP